MNHLNDRKASKQARVFLYINSSPSIVLVRVILIAPASLGAHLPPPRVDDGNFDDLRNLPHPPSPAIRHAVNVLPASRRRVTVNGSAENLRSAALGGTF